MSCIVYTICFSMGSKTGTSRLNPFDSFPLLIETIKVSHAIALPLTWHFLEQIIPDDALSSLDLNDIFFSLKASANYKKSYGSNFYNKHAKFWHTNTEVSITFKIYLSSEFVDRITMYNLYSISYTV